MKKICRLSVEFGLWAVCKCFSLLFIACQDQWNFFSILIDQCPAIYDDVPPGPLIIWSRVDKREEFKLACLMILTSSREEEGGSYNR